MRMRPHRADIVATREPSHVFRTFWSVLARMARARRAARGPFLREVI